MLLVIPVSNSDLKLLPAFLKGFENFHPGSGHKLLVVGNPSLDETLRSVEATLSKYFESTATFTTSVDNQMGWPLAMNHLFYETARHILFNYAPEDPFLWMELDSAPLKQNWLNTIATTYFADSQQAHLEGRTFKPYMGAEVITRESKNGEITPISQTGTHMASVGVYPQDVAARIKMLDITPNIQKAFYEYVQWYTVPNMQKTELIQHNWMTRNYRSENGQLVCDSCNRFAYGVDYNEPVNPNAVLLHGVKDGSLQNLLGTGETPTLLPPKPKEIPQPIEVPKVDPKEELVTIYWRDDTGRMHGEEITRATLEARQAEEQRLAEKELALSKPVVPEVQTESKYDYFPEGKGTHSQPYEPLPQKNDEFTTSGSAVLDVYIPPTENIPHVGFDKDFIQRRDDELRAKEVLLNNNAAESSVTPQQAKDSLNSEKPTTANRKRGKRGPGRPKKVKRTLTEEQRNQKAEHMRAMQKRRWANKQLQEVNE